MFELTLWISDGTIREIKCSSFRSIVLDKDPTMYILIDNSIAIDNVVMVFCNEY